MNFKNWLKNESPVSHYGYEFHSDNSDREGFDKNKKQYDFVPKVSNTPWGGELTSGEREPITIKFSKKDKAIISHPRTARVLEDKLKNSKYNFNILLIENSHGFSREEMLNAYPTQVKNYIKENGIQQEGHITFVKFATSGHLLTPWMILHNVGHAITEHLGKKHSKNWIELNDITYNVFEHTPNLFLFKSAKSGKVEDSAELAHELIAEFLWNGKIRINPNYGAEHEGYENGKDIVGLGLFNGPSEIVEKIEYYIDKCLEECVGQIIYDI